MTTKDDELERILRAQRVTRAKKTKTRRRAPAPPEAGTPLAAMQAKHGVRARPTRARDDDLAIVHAEIEPGSARPHRAIVISRARGAIVGEHG